MRKTRQLLFRGFFNVAVLPIFGFVFSSLILMNSALFDLANGLLERLGLETVAYLSGEVNRAEYSAKREAANKIREKAVSKVKMSARRNIQAMPLEALPVWGVPTVVNATTREVTDLCKIMFYIDELSRLYDAEIDSEETTELCKSLRKEVDEAAAVISISSKEDSIKRIEPYEAIFPEVPVAPLAACPVRTKDFEELAENCAAFVHTVAPDPTMMTFDYMKWREELTHLCAFKTLSAHCSIPLPTPQLINKLGVFK